VLERAMTNASATTWAAVSALSLCLAGPGASASERTETAASVTIVQPAAVTVVSNGPLQALLLTAAIAPAGVVFTASGAVPAAVASAGAGVPGGGRAGGSGSPAARAESGRAGQPAPGGAAPPALVAVGGALGGTTIDGDAVSVSVGTIAGGSAPGSASVAVVIAQFN
jgi:hypothetical protein